MLVAQSDFDVEPYNIPNLDQVINNFTVFAEGEEAKILKRLLGVSLYNEFIDAIEGEDYPDQKWSDILYGALYQIGDLTYEWVGLLGRDGALVPYIYSLWLGATYDNHIGVGGVTVPKLGNADRISPAMRMSSSFLDFKNRVGSKGNSINTLYGFLMAHSEDYPSLLWTDPGSVNQFDL